MVVENIFSEGIARVAIQESDTQCTGEKTEKIFKKTCPEQNSRISQMHIRVTEKKSH
jgi:hypothetical protein